jgi:hypothetical protein
MSAASDAVSSGAHIVSMLSDSAPGSLGQYFGSALGHYLYFFNLEKPFRHASLALCPLIG